MSWLRGAGLTSFGSKPESSTLSLMIEAALDAMRSADLERASIDAVITGYSTTMPHLMLASVFSEAFGITPSYCHGVQMGGATGLGMVMLAHELASSGRYRNVLVVAGENRLTGQNRDASVQTLAQVGDASTEVPLGVTVPAFYALLASEYMQRYNLSQRDLAALAVAMRGNAVGRPGAHLREPISEEDVLSSRIIASPLRLLDCCPISDGGAAVIVSADRPAGPAIRIKGAGQAHLHQHISMLGDIDSVGAALALQRAEADSGVTVQDVDYAGIYDSFTITLAMLIEELGLAPRGGAAERARSGDFGVAGILPLNTHGGLLSYGHCGVAGGMAHLVEAWEKLSGKIRGRQVTIPSVALLHADGGVMSAHVSMFLERVG